MSEVALRQGAILHPRSLRGPYFERSDDLDRKAEAGWIRWLEGSARRPRRRDAAGFVLRVERDRDELASLGDEALGERRREACLRLRREGLDRDPVAGVLALTREVCRRELGTLPTPAQLVAGWGLLRGAAVDLGAEEQPLAAALAAVVGGLARIPVHVIVPSEALGESRLRCLSPLYIAMGLTAGVVSQASSGEERQALYAGDIVYSTAHELVFDYLRDRIELGPQRSEVRLWIRSLRSVRRGEGHGTLLRGLGLGLVEGVQRVLVQGAERPVVVTQPGSEREVLTRISLPEFLRRYARLGALGVAGRASRELRDLYELRTEVLAGVGRFGSKIRVYPDAEDHVRAVAESAEAQRALGRPVSIRVRSKETREVLESQLAALGSSPDPNLVLAADGEEPEAREHSPHLIVAEHLGSKGLEREWLSATGASCEVLLSLDDQRLAKVAIFGALGRWLARHPASWGKAWWQALARTALAGAQRQTEDTARRRMREIHSKNHELAEALAFAGTTE